MSYLFSVLLSAVLALPAAAEEFNIFLEAAEESALASSNRYREAKLAAESARAAAGAAGAALYPRFGLEGSLRYAETIPEISLPAAMGGARPLGDNWSYSIGPAAYWTLDGGELRSVRAAARKAAEARAAEAEQARRQALLKARAAYFGVQLALEKVYLIGEDLQLAVSRFEDIELGARAGARSRLDAIRARQETLAGKRELLRARSALAAELRDFGFLTGVKVPAGGGLPLDARLAGKGRVIPAGPLVRAEPYEKILARLSPAVRARPGNGLPAVKALDLSAGAFLAAARGYKAGKLPRLLFSARSSIDYPNGPNLYSFLQNSAGVSLSLPLFEGGRLAEREKENRLSAEAAAERRDEAARAAERDFMDALDGYNALLEEQDLNVEAVSCAEDAAKLAYAAYRSGGGTWLEVESANLKALQAKTTAASANAEILMKLAVLDSMGD